MDAVKDTRKTYGFIWERTAKGADVERWHFNAMQEVIGEPIVRGSLGIEVGSGCGYDTYIMAKNNPGVKFITIDISDGIYNARELTRGLGNVYAVKCSALDLPVKPASCDFAYSFGVLHHTPNPLKGLKEISRVLKKGNPAFLYLYEDHSENILKYIAVKVVSFIRLVTTRLPQKALYILAWVASPLVYLTFTLPSKIFRKFKATRSIAEHMPFNFGRGPFSLYADLYDRFRAPIEFRFSRSAVRDMFAACGFSNVTVTRLRDTAGWVVWGYKADA